jgi:hypothetical protein
MEPVHADTAFERVVLKWALAVAIIVLLLIAFPVYQDSTARHDFVTGSLATHRAIVLDTSYTSGWNGSQTWYDQEILLRLDNGATVRKSMNGIFIDVEEGDTVVAGLSHGRLVALQGTYVRTDPVPVWLALPIASGALVLSAIYAVLIRRPQLHQRDPIISGYVALAILLAFAMGLAALGAHGPFEAWHPVIILASSILIPLIIFGARHVRRGTKDATSPVEPEQQDPSINSVT